MRIRYAVQFHAFDEELAEGHVHVAHTGFHDLRPVGLLQLIGGDADPEAHCRFDGLAKFAAFGGGLDGNVYARGRTFSTDRFKDFLCHDFRSPACGNGVAFDFRKFSIADRLDRADPFPFRFHGRNGGGTGGCGNLRSTRLNNGRRCGGFGFLLRVLLLLSGLFLFLRLLRFVSGSYGRNRSFLFRFSGGAPVFVLCFSRHAFSFYSL